MRSGRPSLPEAPPKTDPASPPGLLPGLPCGLPPALPAVSPALEDPASPLAAVPCWAPALPPWPPGLAPLLPALDWLCDPGLPDDDPVLDWVLPLLLALPAEPPELLVGGGLGGIDVDWLWVGLLALGQPDNSRQHPSAQRVAPSFSAIALFNFERPDNFLCFNGFP